MDKQYILSEIRRTALARNGIALGMNTFQSQTGIKISNWRGKYWARWSDAVAEAGFSALKRNIAYDNSLLLEKLVQLTRKLSKFPSFAEIKLEKQSDSEFPGFDAFQRLGKLSKLPLILMEYCSSHDNYQDVEQILKTKLDLIKPDGQADYGDMNSKHGHVYLIRSGQHYKIGRTKALYRRASEISNQASEGAEIVHSFSTDDPRGIENYWHERFKEKNVVGKNKQSSEWFALSREDVQAFKRRKSFM
jgi:hypothetical protein